MSYASGFKYKYMFSHYTTIETQIRKFINAHKWNEVPVYARAVFYNIEFPELLLVCADEKYLIKKDDFLAVCNNNGMPISLTASRRNSRAAKDKSTTIDPVSTAQASQRSTISYDDYLED